MTREKWESLKERSWIPWLDLGLSLQSMRAIANWNDQLRSDPKEAPLVRIHTLKQFNVDLYDIAKAIPVDKEVDIKNVVSPLIKALQIRWSPRLSVHPALVYAAIPRAFMKMLLTHEYGPVVPTLKTLVDQYLAETAADEDFGVSRTPLEITPEEWIVIFATFLEIKRQELKLIKERRRKERLKKNLIFGAAAAMIIVGPIILPAVVKGVSIAGEFLINAIVATAKWLWTAVIKKIIDLILAILAKTCEVYKKATDSKDCWWTDLLRKLPSKLLPSELLGKRRREEEGEGEGAGVPWVLIGALVGLTLVVVSD